MKIDLNKNYAVISNHIDKNLLANFNNYPIIEDNITYLNLLDIINTYTHKTICFNDCLRKYKQSEKEEIFNLLKIKKINFINITSNIEEVINSDYLIVYYNQNIAIEGNTLDVLKEEKILKRLGFALPFTFDLSLQLKLYNTIDDTEINLEKLVNKLWN